MRDHLGLAGGKNRHLPGHGQQGAWTPEQLGIVKELTAQKRKRLFSYAVYIDVMSRGTELPSR